MKNSIFMLVAILLASCGDYSVDLGDGYKFSRLDSGNHAISDAESLMIVPPNVTKYSFNEAHIVGLREQSTDPITDDWGKIERGNGYFVIDKSTGKIAAGLSKEDFMLKVESTISDDIDLSVFD